MQTEKRKQTQKPIDKARKISYAMSELLRKEKQ